MKKATVLGFIVFLMLVSKVQAANYTAQCLWKEPESVALVDVEFMDTMEPLPASNFDRLVVLATGTLAGSGSTSVPYGFIHTIDSQTCNVINAATICPFSLPTSCVPAGLKVQDVDDDGNDDVVVRMKVNNLYEYTQVFNGILQPQNIFWTIPQNGENDIPSSENDHILFTDFNNDGKTDVINVEYTGYGGSVPEFIRFWKRQ